jgi:hypothetical protein
MRRIQPTEASPVHCGNAPERPSVVSSVFGRAYSQRMDQIEQLRQALRNLRETEEHRRSTLPELIRVMRAKVLSGDESVIDFYDSLIVEQALTKALGESTEKQTAALDAQLA